MKKTDRTKKLQFSAETIRPLTPDELGRVAGGAPRDADADDTRGDTNNYTCSCANCSYR